jgi:hypothetical protein
MKPLSHILNLLVVASVSSASAATIAQWTFETTLPIDAGPISPEIGSGSASGYHAGTATYSNPVGNGSAESYSVNTWAAGDYFEFSLSTIGYSGIGLSFDQASSSTGPREFDLTYSTDGTSYSTLASYLVLQNGGGTNSSWNSSTYQSVYTFYFDLSSLSSLDNTPSAYFRLVNTSDVAANGGTVAATGTDRVDNFTVYVVPEPSGLLVLGGLMLLGRRRLPTQRG